MHDIALLTDRRYTAESADAGDWYLRNILDDDRLLQAALGKRGLSSVRVDWSRPDVDWSSFRCAVFRTTWDYFDRFAEFAAWLERVRHQTRLCNEYGIVSWNMDKRYLTHLAAKGVPVVPSRVLERGRPIDLGRALESAGWTEAVVKPCVSGAARHTYRIDSSSASDVDARLRPLLEREAFLLQPFQHNVVLQGEDTLMILNGQFTHAVRKTAKPGDFRVQDDHGGVACPHRATREQIDLAERAIDACPGRPVYGRVDMIRDNTGELAIMEVELIEPELWLRNHPPAAEAFADGIAAFLG